MAWQYRKQLVTSTRNHHLAQNSDPKWKTGVLAEWAKGLYSRYKVEDQICFFCRKRGARTGYLPGLGAIWLCKGKHKDYEEVRRELS